MAPRAISLENHKKKFPYEGRTRRRDKAGKTPTALLEMRTAPQKQCETILLPNKMEMEKTSVRTHEPHCARSVRPDLEPNIFPSGPAPTQSIRTQYDRRKSLTKSVVKNIIFCSQLRNLSLPVQREAVEVKLSLCDHMIDMLSVFSSEDRGRRAAETRKGSVQKVRKLVSIGDCLL